MKVGSLVRHEDYGDIGVVTHIGEWKLTFILTDGSKWVTYHNRVEILCK